MLRRARNSITALTFIGFAFSSIAHSRPSDHASTWQSWVEVGGAFNTREDDTTGITTTNRGETTFFVPLAGAERSLLFTQITAKFFDNDAREGNFALGYRQMSRSGFNYGGWIGADVRDTSVGNMFWQFSGGFEALSDNLDLRLNWYGAITGPQSGGEGFTDVRIDGSKIVMIGGEEVGLMGVDGEVGFRVPIEMTGFDPRLFELRLYAGGYYFDHSEALDEIAGTKARLELRVNDILRSIPGSRLTAEYEIAHDNVRDTRHDFGLRIRIPLNSSSTRRLASLDPQDRRMLDGIERDTDIVTAQSKAEPVSDDLTGTALQQVATVGSSGNISTVSRRSGGNTLIIVNGTVTGRQRLRGNQTLVSGGSSLAVRGQRSSTIANIRIPGAPGRLTNPSGNNDNLIVSGSNTHVAGLTIIGRGAGTGDGIDVRSNNRNVVLRDLSISATGGDGIDIDNNAEVRIHNVTTANTDESGIDINNNSTVTLQGGSISNTGSDGIQINNNNSISIAGLTIINPNGDDGININNGNTVHISDVTISGPADDAVQINRNNSLTISGSRFSNTDYGLFMSSNGNTAVLNNVTLSEMSNDAFLIGRTNMLQLAGSTISNIGGDAFNFSRDVTLQLARSTISGNVGGDIFRFGRTNIVQAGSMANTNAATVGGRVCRSGGARSFTGSIGFVDGTVLTDSFTPCN